MQINIPADCPTTIEAVLKGLRNHVVCVGQDGEQGTDYFVKDAVETDPPGQTNLIVQPWLDHPVSGPDTSRTVILPVTDDTVVTVY